MSVSSFIPRATFPTLDSLPRSYFLGHHRSGLQKMKSLLASTDLIIECRDYRVPLTSRNPLFEEALAGRERLIVYTKKDLGSVGKGAKEQRTEDIIRQWHAPNPVLFSAHTNVQHRKSVLSFARSRASNSMSLAGARMLVVGMPNIGKSTLINSLRAESLGTGKKALITGGQPGVTRKVGSSVKILKADEAKGTPPVYLIDTPGVFVPYVPDAGAMLRLSLVGCVRDSIIPFETLVDFLLFHLNRYDPGLYSEYGPPTNDVLELLENVAKKTGKLQKGGLPDMEAASAWFIQRWRSGKLGKFVLDDITEDALEMRKEEERNMTPSYNQARKADKEAKKARAKLKYAEG